MVRSGNIRNVRAILTPPPRKPILDVTIQVITPMFGGSAEPGQVDGSLPVNGKMIRGQLRFWWRACYAHTTSSSSELFANEQQIWGSASNNDGVAHNSAVDVRIEFPPGGRGSLLPNDDPVPNDQWTTRDYPAYALFPFQRQTTGDPRPARRARAGISFQLKLYIAPHILDLVKREKIEAQVHGAVWAWVTFGGVGARTRRGCGALWCEAFAPTSNALDTWFDAMSRRYAPGAVNDNCPPIPILPGSTVLLNNASLDPLAAWIAAINEMAAFRQGRGIARRTKYNDRNKPMPARSLWPEADSIRILSKSHSANHQPADHEEPYFPRAEFGLPIVFHFKDARDGDPQDHTLQGSEPGQTRMASPFILKPLAISADRAVPMVVLLNTLRLTDLGGAPLELTGRDRDGKNATHNIPIKRGIVDTDRALNVSPMTDGIEHGEVAPRSAFLAFVRNRWARNVCDVTLPE